MATITAAPSTVDPNCPPGPLCFDTRPPPAPPSSLPDPTYMTTKPSVWRSASPPTHSLSNALGLLKFAALAILAHRTFARTRLSKLLALGVVLSGLLLYGITGAEAVQTITPCDGPAPICVPAGPAPQPTDPIYSSSPSTYLLDDALRLAKYIFIAFVVFRACARASISTLLPLALIAGGFLYDATQVQASSTADLSSTVTTVQTGVVASATPPSRFWNCYGVINCPYPGGPPGNTVYIGSSPAAYFLSEAGRVLHLTLMAFLASRLLAQCSMNALVCLCLMIGLLVYQAAKVEASVSSTTQGFADAVTDSVTAATQSATTALVSVVTTSAEAVSRVYDCKYCKPTGHHHSAAGRLASPNMLLVLIGVAACFLSFVMSQHHGMVPGTLDPNDPSTPDNVHGPSSREAASDSRPSDGDQGYTTIHRFLAGRMLSERRPVKQANPLQDSKKNIVALDTEDRTVDADTAVTDNRQVSRGFAAMVGLLLLSIAIILIRIPMALAESTTSKPAFTLSKELIAIPMTTGPSGPTTATLQRHDRSQTWIYQSEGVRSQPNPLLFIIPMILVGSFFVPALVAFVAAWALHTRHASEQSHVEISEASGSVEEVGIIDSTLSPDFDVAPTTTLSPRQIQSELPPVWITYYSTTTLWLPTVTVTAPPCTETNAAVCPIALHSNPWNPPAYEICAEPNPAVCPIVLGWKPLGLVSAASAKAKLGKAAIAMLTVACFVALAVAQEDHSMYLHVEPTAAVGELVERTPKGTLWRNGSITGAAAAAMASAGWTAVSWACLAAGTVVFGFFV